MTLTERCLEYVQSLDGQNRELDFIFEGKEYFVIEDPMLRGLVFRMDVANQTIIFDKDPR